MRKKWFEACGVSPERLAAGKSQLHHSEARSPEKHTWRGRGLSK